MKKILVINSGSSSLKYQLIEMPSAKILAKWMVDRIGIWSTVIKHNGREWKIEIQEDIENHKIALEKVLYLLIDEKQGVISSYDQIDAVWHRIVHGWEYFQSSAIVDDDVQSKIQELSELAPLHNPANLMWIQSVQIILPKVPNVAVFDTAFHQTMPASSYIYSIPYKYYEQYKIRKYGFHGTSHDYVSQRACEILGQKIQSMKIISCHIGNGASVCAINCGKSLDTSMGFTPLEWLTMGTRCGDIDPAILPFIMQKENLNDDEISIILNKQSGVLGISWNSSDMRDIEAWYIAGKHRETLAMEIYVNKIVKYIWWYSALMNGCDVIVFTAWTLENSSFIRKLIAEKLQRLWVEFDWENNDFRWEERTISKANSKIKLMVIPTNEEYMIAKDTFELIW